MVDMEEMGRLTDNCFGYDTCSSQGNIVSKGWSVPGSEHGQTVTSRN